MTTDIHAAFEAKYKASAQDPAVAEELRHFTDGFTDGFTAGTEAGAANLRRIRDVRNDSAEEWRTEVRLCRETIAERDSEIAALTGLLVALVEQLDEGDDQAPGHCHRIPGIWDEDNGAKAGKPCALCALWALAKGYAASPQPKPPPIFPSTEGQRIARQIREGKEGKEKP